MELFRGFSFFSKILKEAEGPRKKPLRHESAESGIRNYSPVYTEYGIVTIQPSMMP